VVPTYVYRCDDGHQFETVQRMSDDPLDACEVCGAPAKRLLFAPAIHFKGTGFHNTDYGTKKRGAKGEGESSGSSDAGSGGGEGGGAANGSGDSSAGSSGGAKQATKADTAARTTGP
jgi:putative FmdB family regulatory protein